MSGPPRDWDKELAEIDKLIAASPQVPAPAQRQKVLKPGESPRPLPSRRELLGAWSRVLLGVVVGFALTQWPYAHDCGTGLLLYSGAVGVVMLTGIWGMVFSWRRRLALAHIVALAVFLWGAVVAAGLVLPRVGYARVPATWSCP